MKPTSLLILPLITFLTFASGVPPNYMPLNVGNSWTYKRTVSGGVLTWSFITENVRGGLQDMNKNMNRGLGLRGVKPGSVTEEVYEIVRGPSRKGQNMYEVQVSDKKARDGRYAKAKSILWTRTVINNEMTFKEVILKESIMVTGGEELHKADFLAVPKMEHLGISKTLVPNNVEMKINPNGKFTKVTVPAGTFDNCIEVLVMVLPGNSPSESDFGKGWVTRSHYAPGVGLVKEVQQNHAGIVTYTLELTKFTLK